MQRSLGIARDTTEVTVAIVVMLYIVLVYFMYVSFVFFGTLSIDLKLSKNGFVALNGVSHRAKYLERMDT